MDRVRALEKKMQLLYKEKFDANLIIDAKIKHLHETIRKLIKEEKLYE